MDVGGSDQESSLFQAFIVPSVGIENKNVNKINDPIRQANLPDQEVPKADSNKNDQPQPSDAQFVRFEQFSTLPVGLRKYVGKDLIGTPLEDIDPFYKDKQTFIVVNQNRDLFRFSSSKALCVLRPNSAVRRTAAHVLTHPYWTVFMILVILINCIISQVVRPNDLFVVPWELIFLIIYIMEFAVKVLARGFALSKFSYLCDLWNWLDLLLLAIAISAICVQPKEFIYYSPVLCELRVLKICSISLNLRRTIDIYWDSLVKMRDLLLYIAFTIFVASVLCLQVYMGILTQRCVQVSTITGNTEMHRACGNSSGAQTCPENYICLQGDHSLENYGYTSYDTIFWSLLAVVRTIQRDFWEEQMQYLTATAGPWHILLFIWLIYYVSFQLCALLWTPIALAYNYMNDELWENDLLKDLNAAKQCESMNMTDNKTIHRGCLAKFQRFIFNIIYNPFVVLFVILCILLNTLTMALDHHMMAREFEIFLKCCNYFFVIVYVVEAILKLTALGPIQYFRDEWNTFDFIVTALGVIELVLEGVHGLSVLRAFRLLRPLRLCKVLPAFDSLLKRIRHLFSVLRNQTIILCMFIYIFVVFGCRTFGKYYTSDKADRFESHEMTRWNFTDLFHSFMVVFRSLCGEWVESMYDCIRVNDKSSIVYFVALAFIGSFLIMHLFVALILTNDDSSVFSVSSASSPSSSLSSSSTNESHANQSTTKSPSSRKFNLHTFLKEKLLEPNIQKIYDANQPIKSDMETQPTNIEAAPASLSSNHPDDKNHSQSKLDHLVVDKKFAEDQNDAKCAVAASNAVVIAPVATTEDEDEDDATINTWSKFRVKALKFNQNTYFGYIVLAIIIIGSINVAYVINSSSLALLGKSYVVDIAFCIIMIIEFISKIISCGWKSYFKNIWCLIDLFNTIVAIVDVFVCSNYLLILKALRPLSLVSRRRGLKVVATTIGCQAFDLIKPLLLCAVFWLIFAIMGVQMFGGKFYRCVDENHHTLNSSSVSNQIMCDNKNGTNGYVWMNSVVNFDNVIEAYLSLLEVASFKGWIGIIHDAIDSRDVDDQPIREQNIYLFFYFVIFIIFGVFTCANLIAGLLVKHILSNGSLIDVFASSKKSKSEANNSNQSNTPDDSLTANTSVAVNVKSVHFEWIAFLLCILYIISMSFDYYLMSHKEAEILDYINVIFSVLFFIETALRFNMLRRSFLFNNWNFYDSIVAILWLIDFIMTDFAPKYFISVGLLRIIRVIRFMPLFVTYSPQLKMGLEALRRSRVAAYNLCYFLFMIIFVYALIGVAAFKNAARSVAHGNDQISFHNVDGAVMLLIQISTSAGWDGTYHALIEQYNPFVVFLYMWSFLFICILTILNLMLMIILCYFKLAFEMESESKQLPTADINDFNNKWKTIASPNRPLFINKVQLPALINNLEKSSSLRAGVNTTDEHIQLLGIPVHNEQQFYYGEVLIALNKNRSKHTPCN